MNIEKNYFIDPEYQKKSQEFYQLKQNFNKWIEFSNNKEDLLLEDSRQAIKDYGITIPRILMPSATYPLKLYRVRVIAKDSQEDITDPQTFSYPPAKHTDRYQRANAPKFPVFYGAMDGKTAFEEIKINGEHVKAGDTVFLSEWKVKDPAVLNLCFLTTPDIVQDHQLYAQLTKKVYSEIERIFKSEEYFFSKTQRYLYEQISKLFLTGKHIQSGTVAHDILFQTPEVNGVKINGIIYPSCSNDFRSVNCALTPEFVDHHLILERVRKVSFEHFTEDGAQTNGYYFAEVHDGMLTWQTYQSQLTTSGFDIILTLANDWPSQEVKTARFFLQNQDTDLKAYCRELVKGIDMDNYKVTPKEEAYFHSKQELYLMYDRKLEEGIAHLQQGDQQNSISMIRMAIPCRTFTTVVEPARVLSEKMPIISTVNS